jgi:RNA polymerase primary sigma factor
MTLLGGCSITSRDRPSTDREQEASVVWFLVVGARERGFLTNEEVIEALALFDVSAEQMDNILQRLQDENIEVVEVVDELDAEEFAREARLARDEELALKAPTNDPVRMYLKEIGKVPLLTAEQEVILTKAIDDGETATAELARVDDGDRKCSPARLEELERMARHGQAAKKKLIEANLRLVVSIAKRYVGRGMLFLDLIQEGNLGLMWAVEEFDDNKGFKFSTYATWWIRQAITRALQKSADVAASIPSPAVASPEPSPGFDEGEQADGEEGSYLDDFIEESDAVSFLLLEEQLDLVLHTFSEREKKVIQLRFGLIDGHVRTVEEVCRELEVTRERIRQIESKTFSRLRQSVRDQGLGYDLE